MGSLLALVAMAASVTLVVLPQGTAAVFAALAVILVALDPEHLGRVTKAVKLWYEEAAKHPGWEKPALRVFSWPAEQIV